MRVVDSLNLALHDLLRQESTACVVGQDILDPYGGAFKVTRGLSTEFPDRVLTTPVSEAAMIGLCTGMAMHGKRPIVEIMFGDFLSLAMDQILNHAVKFAWMYRNQVSVPLVIRVPMGGRRGYGPTHSQSLEKHFCGVPGLTVLAVHQFGDPGGLLRQAFTLRSPCLFIENKVLYARQIDVLPTCPRPDVVVITYGGCVEHAVEAARELEQREEIAVRVVALTQLSPFPESEVLESCRGLSHVLVVEEGTAGWNLAGECARTLIGRPLHFAELAAPAHPIPSCATWEQRILPGTDHITKAVLALLERN